jgi:subtilisin family serine protease
MNNTGQGGGTNDADIDAPEAWDVRTDASSIIVAVIDTGVRYTHEDLAANMWRNPGEIAGNSIDDDGNGLVDDVFGARYEGVTVTGNPMDDNSHGSHVAGTIGGVGNNGKGVVGVSWGAKIMALKFLSAGGSGSTSDAIKCVDYAISKGAKIMSNSWGGGDYSQSLYDAINRARVRGILFVAAAGNSGLNNDGSPFYPANYALDNVISVAATDRYDALASFSNYGVTTVDLGAPGVSIYSSVHNSDSAYGTKSGTSMATPHVSGACALVWAQFPAMSASEIKARILDTTDPLASLAGKTVSGGRLNVHKALTQDVPPTNEAPVVTITSPPDGSSFSNGAAITFTGNANDTEDGDLTASLVWTSNIDGVIGNGGSFTAVLSPGAHTVTAAVVDSGGRVGTDSITVTVVVPAPPAAPSNLTAIVSGSTVTLNWADNSNNETGFAIERRTKSKNAWTEFTQVGAVGANVRSFVNTSVPSGTHQYRVRAYNGVGNSAYSNSAQVKVR